MRWKSTLVLVALTVALGAYVALYEIKQPAPEQRRERASRVLTMNPDAISAVTIERPQTGAVELVRDGVLWRLGAGGVRADPTVVQDLLDATRSLRAERTLSGPDGHSLEAATYGLEPPVARLVLREGDRTTALRFGEATAVAGRRYLQIEGQAKIFVVSSALFDGINRPADAFRDAQLVRFSYYDAEELAIATPTSLSRLARGQDVWYLVEPLSDPADRSGVNRLLGKLAALKTVRVLEPGAGEPADPRTRIGAVQTLLVLRTGGPAPVTTELRFGAPLAADPTQVPAWRSDEPHLFVVPAADAADLVPTPQTLRDRACFVFFQSDVQRIDVTWEDHAWGVERAGPGPGGGAGEGWREASSGGSALDPMKVEAWFQQLAELRAQKILESPEADHGRYGLTAPTGVISVWTKTAVTPQQLLMGAPVGASASAGRYGWLTPREVLVEVPPAAEGLAQMTLDGLRPSPPQPATDSGPESRVSPAPPAAAR